MNAPSAVRSTFENARQSYKKGNYDAAHELCRHALMLDANHVDALSLLGKLELRAGRLDAAINWLERAVRVDPKSARDLCNLGVAYHRQQLLERATEVLARALKVSPEHADAAFNLGLVLLDRGEDERGLKFLARAVQIKPESSSFAQTFAKELRRLGRAFSSARQPSSALPHFQRAFELDPQNTAAPLAATLCKLGRVDEALDLLERLLKQYPDLSEPHSTFVFNAAFSARYDSTQLHQLIRTWADRHTTSERRKRAAHSNDRDSDRRLRIAYVSPDFRGHVQRLFTVPVLKHHDHSRFEILAYSSTAAPDAWTAEIQAMVDEWHDVTPLSDGDLAHRIREDRVDVLVDLTMHMAGSRLKTFAEKPAPVQISWLAYPGTTGIDAIDYRITDPVLDPPGQPLPYTEQSLWMPASFWCFGPRSDEGRVNDLPMSTAGYPTFGCLNNFMKVNPSTLRLWARVLQSVPSSRMVMLAPQGGPRQLVAEVFAELGVDLSRVDFVDMQGRSDYLATYNRIDIALDTLPYNGHTTSLDAYWMGVPVVSLVGETVVGRAGLCLASNLDLNDWIARTPDEFVNIATTFAADQRGLETLRQGLRQRLQASPLMDAPRFTRDLEALYREAWHRWCASPPKA